MMEPFPEEWQLLSLFEIEPRILDPGVPWAYNNLTFETTRGSDRILCVIEPGYERLDFTWWHNQSQHLKLELHCVSGLTIVTGAGNDYMVATFRDQYLTELRLHLRPTIECQWGTTNELP
jgi:hypothetical protein